MQLSVGPWINRRLRTFGLELRRTQAGSSMLSPDTSFMKPSRHAHRLKEELAQAVEEALSQVGVPLGEDDIGTIVDEFFQVYPERPVKDNQGGSGFHNLFWIYTIVRLLSPDLLVESGVWRGQSVWMMSQAAPAAEIHAFDVSFSRLASRIGGVIYHEHDWSEVRIDASGRRALAFFDCHVNQALRVAEARERGFSFLVFDDAAPTAKLYAYRFPGVPTIPMLYDDLEEGEVVRWRWRGHEVTYRFTQADTHGARELIDQWTMLPDVGGPTRYGGFSFLTLVRI